MIYNLFFNVPKLFMLSYRRHFYHWNEIDVGNEFSSELKESVKERNR